MSKRKNKNNRAAVDHNTQSGRRCGGGVQLWRPGAGIRPTRIAGLRGMRADGPLV